MSEFTRSDIHETGPALRDALADAGVAVTDAWLDESGGLHVTVADTDDAVAGPIIAAYQTVADYRGRLPEAIRTHAGHLRDYRDAVRAGQTPTPAQAAHVLADVIDWLRLDEDRL